MSFHSSPAQLPREFPYLVPIACLLWMNSAKESGSTIQGNPLCSGDILAGILESKAVLL